MHSVGTSHSPEREAPTLSAAKSRGNTTRRLVLVQGNTLTRSAVARFFARTIEVASFASPVPAESYIRQVSLGLYVLIGQLFLGEKSGTEWIQRWREQYPHIQRVVLATGLDDVPVAPNGVDAIVSKPFDVHLVTKLLSLDQPTDSGPPLTQHQRIPI